MPTSVAWATEIDDRPGGVGTRRPGRRGGSRPAPGSLAIGRYPVSSFRVRRSPRGSAVSSMWMWAVGRRSPPDAAGPSPERGDVRPGPVQHRKAGRAETELGLHQFPRNLAVSDLPEVPCPPFTRTIASRPPGGHRSSCRRQTPQGRISPCLKDARIQWGRITLAVPLEIRIPVKCPFGPPAATRMAGSIN